MTQDTTHHYWHIAMDLEGNVIRVLKTSSRYPSPADWQREESAQPRVTFVSPWKVQENVEPSAVLEEVDILDLPRVMSHQTLEAFCREASLRPYSDPSRDIELAIRMDEATLVSALLEQTEPSALPAVLYGDGNADSSAKAFGLALFRGLTHAVQRGASETLEALLRNKTVAETICRNPDSLAKPLERIPHLYARIASRLDTRASIRPSTGEPTHTLHVARDVDGRLYMLTDDDTTASMLAAEGFSVEENTPLARIIEDDLIEHRVDRVMDDSAWHRISAELTGYPTLSQKDPLYAINPSDLPAELAGSRLSVLSAFMSDADVQAYLELSEIVMAAKHKRPVNAELFSKDSREASFRRIFNNDLKELSQWQIEIEQMADEISTQNSSERAGFGDSAPGSAIQEALIRRQLDELNYVLAEIDEPADADDMMMRF